MTRSFILRTPSLLIFLICLALFTIATTLAAHYGLISTSFVKTLGKTLCLCLAALAMDLIWGYAGILSPRPHGLLRLRRLHDRHVADVCPHRGDRHRLPGQLRPARHARGNPARHRHPDLRRRRCLRPARDLELRPQPAPATDAGRGPPRPPRAGLRLARLPQPASPAFTSRS